MSKSQLIANPCKIGEAPWKHTFQTFSYFMTPSTHIRAISRNGHHPHATEWI